jgi:hypothetical protein
MTSRPEPHKTTDERLARIEDMLVRIGTTLHRMEQMLSKLDLRLIKSAK